MDRPLSIFIIIYGLIIMANKENEDISSASDSRTLRSSETFDFKSDCLYCTNYAKYDKKKKRNDVWPVKSFDFQKTIVQTCKERNDTWGVSVLGRIEHVIDLHAADAVYHIQCDINFRTGKDIPLKYQANKKARLSAKGPGRPIDKVQILHSRRLSDMLKVQKELLFLLMTLCMSR